MNPSNVLPTLRLLLVSCCVLVVSTTISITSADDSKSFRVATFNTSLNRASSGRLAEELQTRDSPHGQAVAAILQTVRPDVVLLNEVDFDAEHRAVTGLLKNYLAVPQGDREALDYPYRYIPAVNTGVPSGLDLNNDGKKEGGGDCFGFGRFPGQYGFVVLSRFPIQTKQIRTFQRFRWSDMPGALAPVLDDKPYYSPKAWQKFRLSSKNHCDVPIQIGDQTFHFLVSHPTPPVFDGPEDRNGKRNHDEIRLWADYVSPGKSSYLYADSGQRGGLDNKTAFVVAGDLNADPVDGASYRHAILQLLRHPRVQDPLPASKGADEAAKVQGQANTKHRGPAKYDTGDFFDGAVGNLRIDYVLPSREFEILAAGVFWPEGQSNAASLLEFSDHRLVWVDLQFKDGKTNE